MPTGIDFSKLTPEQRKWVVQALAAESRGKIGPKSKAQLDAIRGGNVPTPRPEQIEAPPGRSLLSSLGQGLLGFTAEIGPEAVGAGLGAGLGATAGPPGVIGGAILGAAGGEALQQVLGGAAPSLQPPSGQPGTSQEAATRIAEAATMGALQEAGPVIRGGVLGRLAPGQAAAKELGASVSPSSGRAAASREFGVALSPAQLKQTTATSATENIVRRSLGGAQIFKRFDVQANRQLIRAGHQIADDVSSQARNPREVGELIQSAIADAERFADEAIGAVRQGIREKAGDVPIDRRLVQARAKQLLAQSDEAVNFAPSLEGVESLRKARAILSDFAESGEPLTISGAMDLRSQLLNLTRDRELTPSIGQLRQLTKVLDESIQNALERSGNTGLLRQFRASNASFANTQRALETGIVQKLSKSEKPEELASYLLNRGGESGIREVSNLIRNSNPKVWKEVQRGVIEQLLDDAIQKDVSGISEGVLVGDALLSRLDRLGDDFLKSVFAENPAFIEKFQRFANLANTISLKSSVTRPVSAESTSLLAFGQGSAATVAAGGILSGRPEIAAAAAPIVIGPPAMAYIMTRPKGIELLTKAALTPPKSPSARQITTQLSVMLEAYEREQGRRKPFGATIQERIPATELKP